MGLPGREAGDYPLRRDSEAAVHILDERIQLGQIVVFPRPQTSYISCISGTPDSSRTLSLLHLLYLSSTSTPLHD